MCFNKLLKNRKRERAVEAAIVENRKSHQIHGALYS